MKKIGFWTTTSLVTGNLVGSGVFLLPATLGAFGSLSLLGWLITCMGAIFLSLVFAKFSEILPKTGGPHVYVKEAFGETASFYVAWGYWILAWISNAALVVAASGYISQIAGGLTAGQSLGVELFIIFTVTSINLCSIKFAGKCELILTVLKILPLIIIPTIGLFYVDWSHFTPLNPSDMSLTQGLATVLFVTIWGFIGLESATVPGEEIENPKKTIPRATVIGTSIAAVIYLIGSVATIGVLSRPELMSASAPYAQLASHLFGGNWGVAVGIAAIICALGSFNGWTLVVGRIAYGASHDGLFPRFFSATTKAGAPKWGIIVSALCTSPLLILTISEDLVAQFNYILDVSVSLILVIYLICVAAYFKVAGSDFKSRLVGIGALAFTTLAMFCADPIMLVVSGSILVLGIPVRYWMTKGKRVTSDS